MRKIFIMMILIFIITSCKKSDNSVTANKQFKITISSSEPLRIYMNDGPTELVNQGSVQSPFTYSFTPKPGDMIGISIIYNANISITESYNGKTDNASTAITAGVKTNTGGTVQYYYPIPQ